MKAARELNDKTLAIIRKAQREAHEDGRFLERALWIEAIKEIAPESFKKILLQKEIVQRG